MLHVSFENELHRRIHQVLLQYGMTFEVNANLRVGLHYRHPVKPITVFIKEGDEALECYTEVYGKVMTDRDYSTAEWNWISTPTNEAEMVNRELYIQVQVRPRILSAFPDSGPMKITGGT